MIGMAEFVPHCIFGLPDILRNAAVKGNSSLINTPLAIILFVFIIQVNRFPDNSFILEIKFLFLLNPF